MSCPGARERTTPAAYRIGHRHGQKVAEPYRHACGQPGAHAPDDAQDEPGEAGGRPWPDVPTCAEIRERHQSGRREPTPAHLSHPASPGLVLLRGLVARTGCAQWNGRGATA